ncbi:enoyl-CoA hydratase/carnithine racemase [Tahibacter aquaticus]|uniref:3-hydroxyisobutyryl-CoA hydrolase n=1 Tax=Tahibacter aquaticus TaxID=520092 RepID=A0A4R6YTI3_9GAMM|nr:enoyl-CoA hydratase/isomerase family protein [Tahibacter aquaticus]TDR41535.1 enoyl-CoA hydratase/carnithine racemase [Tahibacter aquaticus]
MSAAAASDAASGPTASPVLFDEWPSAGGKRIGVATLNAPASLNGLSLAMAQLLDAQLAAWAGDAGVALVVLQGAGEKAFCAGGDLHGLYRGMRDYVAGGAGDIRNNSYAVDFFTTEYRLDYRIHTYPKPLLCWGHGIVMGGGIGLMAGAGRRVVSERSRLAFPEIGIGLYPDVAGSWLLPRVPGSAGLFLALTGAPLNAGDAIYAGLADVFVPEAQRAAVYARLGEQRWSGAAQADAQLLHDVLATFAQAAAPGPLQQHAALLQALPSDDLPALVAAIAALPGDDAWLQTAQKTLAAGSPGSARLGFALQQRAAQLSLADTFRLEYTVSLHCAAHGDFAEGIRALLIDKDKNPQWNPATLALASAAWVEPFFHAPWPAHEHPLAGLGHTTEHSA